MRPSDHNDPSSTTQAAHRRMYHGSSMSPTLKPADVLHVAPCAPGSISVGDMVVFEPETGGTPVVHRVVAMDGQRVRTRGDANADPDPLPIAWDRILGRVVYADGVDGVRPIHGGVRGRIAASLVAMRSAAARVISRVLHRPYMLLAGSGVFRLLRPALPEVRAVAFQREDGIELRLFLGQTPIGLLRPTRGRWLIRRPFRLIVDQDMLARLVRERDRRMAQSAKSA
jgi:hypothetical protein